METHVRNEVIGKICEWACCEMLKIKIRIGKGLDYK